MPDPRVVLQCEALVVERDDTRYRVVTPDGSTVHDSLGEALRSIAGLMDETEGWDGLSLGLPVDELLIAAEAGGLDLLFPWSGCGFAKINGHWLPAAGLREFDGEPGATFDLVDTYGDLGVTADLYRYGEVFLVDWSDAEFENRGFEVLGTITEDEAHRIAGERADVAMEEAGLIFDDLCGLDNLEARIDLPTDAVPIQERSTYTQLSDSVADLTVHRVSDGSLLITESGSKSVIGRFASLADLDAAWTVDDSLVEHIEDLS